MKDGICELCGKIIYSVNYFMTVIKVLRLLRVISLCVICGLVRISVNLC